MNDIGNMLGDLRRLRQHQEQAHDKAEEYQRRATAGMTRQRATDTGGTGHCPLTDFADAHIAAMKRYHEAKRKADAIWEQIKPLLADEGFDEQQVIDLSYNQAQSLYDVCSKIKRSQLSVSTMLRKVVDRMALRAQQNE